MNLDFLTPELFNMLVITNLIVGILLVSWRFYVDMQYDPENEQVTGDHTSDTRPNADKQSQQEKS